MEWNATKSEYETISKIAKRAIDLRISEDFQSTQMDIEATHSNGCQLLLDKLLAFDDFNFIHDVCGIARHLDRRTGKLGGFFHPRCAAPQNKTLAA